MNIESKRLIIRPAIFDDFPVLLYYYNKEKNMQFIQSGKHDWSQNEVLKKWDDLNKGNNIGLRIIIEKETGAIIGECGFLQLKKNDPSHIEIGYMLDESYWQNGYGSEIVEALINYGKNEMNLPKLKAGVNAQNIYSIRILEKHGFSEIDQIDRKENDIYLIYEIDF